MSDIKFKFQSIPVTTSSRECPRVYSSKTKSCLICHKRLNGLTISAPLLDKNSAKKFLNQIASVLEVSSSIYQMVDLNNIPVPLLCKSCCQTVLDAFKVQSDMKTLRKQLKRLTEIIKRDIIQSFQLDSQKSKNGTSADCGQVRLIRKTFAQCWGTCKVNANAGEIPPEVPSSTSGIDVEHPSPFSGYADEAFEEIDGMREHSEDKIYWNLDAVKSEVAESDIIPNGKRKLIAVSKTSKEDSNKLTTREADPLLGNLPKRNNTLGGTNISDTFVSSTMKTGMAGPSNPRQNVVRCNRCGKAFTKNSSLNQHLRKKYPCVNRNLFTATDSTVLVEREGEISEQKIASPKIELPVTSIVLKEYISNENNSESEKCGVAITTVTNSSATTITRRSGSAPEHSVRSNFISMKFEDGVVPEEISSSNKVGESDNVTADNDNSEDVSNYDSDSLDSEFNNEKEPKRMKARPVHRIAPPPQLSGIVSLQSNLKCPQCPLSFHNLGYLRIHRKEVHGYLPPNARVLESKFKCNQCECSYTVERNLARHVKKAHLGIQKALPCNLCDRTFTSKSYLKIHIQTKHVRCSECTLCGENVNEKMLQHHIELHNGSKDFPCKQCDNRLPTYHALMWHIGRYHSDGINLNKNFKCKSCPREFNMFQELLQHKQVHLKMGKRKPLVTCTSCGAKCKTKEKHKCRCHQARHRCRICKQICFSFEDLCAHKKSEHGLSNPVATRVKVYKCTLCPKAFTQKKHLASHLMQHGGKENFNCTLCDAVFKTSVKLKYHLRWHEKGLPNPAELNFNFKCNICDKLYDQKDQYEFHMKKHENPDEFISKFIQAKVDDQKNLMSFDCNVCIQKFSTESHTNTETNQIEIVCQHGNCNCKATFTDLKTFMYHHRKVCQITYRLANFDMRVPCDECGKTLGNYRHLKVHKDRVHPGSESFICQFCGKAFGRQHMLEGHMLVHISERNFQCHVCGSKFKDSSQLNGHIKRCHSGAQFLCDVCKKMFKTKVNLRKHKDSVHSKSEPQFPCHVCGKLFKSKDYARNHIYTTHEKRRKPRDRKTSNHDGEA